jgi:hypothetical protein
MWSTGRRILLTASVAPASKNKNAWWPGGTVHNTYADTDDIAAMWYFNQAVLDNFQRTNNGLTKYDLAHSQKADGCCLPLTGLRFDPSCVALLIFSLLPIA